MDEKFQNLAKDISSQIQEVDRIPNMKLKEMHIKMHHCETSENKTKQILKAAREKQHITYKVKAI